MAEVRSYYQTGTRPFRAAATAQPGSATSLPLVSTQLDSLRAYNFEVHFNGDLAKPYTETLILAAKRVQSAGASVENIEVRRLNDLMHYPGAANHDQLIITFDHLLLREPAEGLYNWFSNGSYNMRNGVVQNANVGKVHSIDVIHLDNSKNVKNISSYYGVYVEKFAPGELNYATANEFHTFDVTFRYDFMEYTARASGPTTQPATGS